jgi:NitT/TauT family transport system ATP-binding protein
MRIDVNNVLFGYDHIPVISEASMSTQEPFALMGPSGCGKSTIFRLLAGLEQPINGSVTIDGQTVTRPSSMIRLSFQDYDAFPWATVKRNIALALSKSSHDSQHIDVSQLIERTGLSDAGRLFPRQLSGGMRKRLALARIIAGNPAIALLDEPFSSLDTYARENLQELLHALVVEREILLGLITHDIEEAVFLSCRIFIVSQKPLRILNSLLVSLPYPRPAGIRQTRIFREQCNRVHDALSGIPHKPILSGVQ